MTEFESNTLDALCECAGIVTAEYGLLAQPLNTTPWIAVSLLQKAIRRGEAALALQAAATLLELDPPRFWRRLGIVAFEDVGVGSISLVASTLAGMAGKAARASQGGEWQVAAKLVLLLANALKSRAVDDLLMIADSHPRYARMRLALASGNVQTSVDTFRRATTLEEAAVALWSFHGFLRDAGSARKSSDVAIAFELAAEHKVPRHIIELCRLGYQRTREPLALIFPLIYEARTATLAVVDDDLPAEAQLDGIPLWSVDKFTRPGRAALAEFLNTNASTAKWIAENCPRSRRVEALGRLVFAVEGGQMRNRASWPLADDLRETWQSECLGVQCANGTEALKLIHAEIPLLNELRAKCLK